MERLYELRDIVKAAPGGATHYDQGLYYREDRKYVMVYYRDEWSQEYEPEVMRSLDDIKYIIHLLETIQF